MTKAISEVITDRLKKAGKRFHANDNISDYINDKERDLLVDELQEKFEQVLKSLVIDTETDPNSNGTARRLAKMYVFETIDRKSTRLNSSHMSESRMPSSA